MHGPRRAASVLLATPPPVLRPHHLSEGSTPAQARGREAAQPLTERVHGGGSKVPLLPMQLDVDVPAGGEQHEGASGEGSLGLRLGDQPPAEPEADGPDERLRAWHQVDGALGLLPRPATEEVTLKRVVEVEVDARHREKSLPPFLTFPAAVRDA